jgi:hypothetical protein
MGLEAGEATRPCSPGARPRPIGLGGLLEDVSKPAYLESDYILIRQLFSGEAGQNAT